MQRAVERLRRTLVAGVLHLSEMRRILEHVVETGKRRIEVDLETSRIVDIERLGLRLCSVHVVAHVHAQRRRSSGLSGELEGILPFPRGLAVGRLVAAAEEAPLVYRREAVLGGAVVAVQINIGKDARRRRDRVDAGIERPVPDFRLAVCIRRDIDEPQALRPKAVGRINEHFRVPEAHDPHTVENRVAGEGVAPEAGLRRPDDELAGIGVEGVDAQPRRGDAVRRPGRFVPPDETFGRNAEGDAVADIDGSFAVKRNSADGERQASRREFNRAGLQRRRNGGQRAEVRDERIDVLRLGGGDVGREHMRLARGNPVAGLEEPPRREVEIAGHAVRHHRAEVAHQFARAVPRLERIDPRVGALVVGVVGQAGG